MIDIITLYFAKDFQSPIEPFQLLFGSGIWIVAVIILIKKIINRRNKMSQMNYFVSYLVNWLLKGGLLDDI